MIVINNVNKTFKIKDRTVEAVNNVSLTINHGEIFGIIGFSGAGKSTLVRLINALEKPDSGTIMIDGVDMASLKEKELRQKRQKIGMIFQQFNLLWSCNVYDNIALPLKIAKVSPEKIKEKVEQLMALVGISDKRHAYPAQLSGGQKQRVGIARALANDPTVLLCDEATSALDPETTRSILHLLKEINQKLQVTVVIISHEMAAIKTVCDRVAVMDRGTVIEVNTVENLFFNPQHEVTKSFVQDLPDPNEYRMLIDSLRQEVDNGYLLQLNFPPNESNQPLLSEIIIEHQLQLNILHGKLFHTATGTIGTLYVQVKTDLSLPTLKSIFANKNISIQEVI